MRRYRLVKEELDGFAGEHGAGQDARESGREPGWRLGDVAAKSGEEPVAYFVAAGLVEPAADGMCRVATRWTRGRNVPSQLGVSWE
ncbi:MAG TPA: hypothetical protein VGS19_28005, partial [Streptosporangiaceae bacterium]|nr:hypothetical protein [Streptosporangiaceae bacterium]